MTSNRKSVIEDLKRKLKVEMEDARYYHKKWCEKEKLIADLKETIAELKEPKL